MTKLDRNYLREKKTLLNGISMYSTQTQIAYPSCRLSCEKGDGIAVVVPAENIKCVYG